MHEMMLVIYVVYDRKKQHHHRKSFKEKDSIFKMKKLKTEKYLHPNLIYTYDVHIIFHNFLLLTLIY